MIARRAREHTLSGADNQQLRPGDTQRPFHCRRTESCESALMEMQSSKINRNDLNLKLSAVFKVFNQNSQCVINFFLLLPDSLQRDGIRKREF